MLQEIKGGAVSPLDEHEVYSGTAHPLHHRQIIETAFCDVIKGNSPGEKAKFDLQSARVEADLKGPVVHSVEKEETKKEQENRSEDTWAASLHAPDEQQERENGKRQE